MCRYGRMARITSHQAHLAKNLPGLQNGDTLLNTLGIDINGRLATDDDKHALARIALLYDLAAMNKKHGLETLGEQSILLLRECRKKSNTAQKIGFGLHAMPIGLTEQICFLVLRDDAQIKVRCR